MPRNVNQARGMKNYEGLEQLWSTVHIFHGYLRNCSKENEREYRTGTDDGEVPSCQFDTYKKYYPQ